MNIDKFKIKGQILGHEIVFLYIFINFASRKKILMFLIIG